MAMAHQIIHSRDKEKYREREQDNDVTHLTLCWFVRCVGQWFQMCRNDRPQIGESLRSQGPIGKSDVAPRIEKDSRIRCVAVGGKETPFVLAHGARSL